MKFRQLMGNTEKEQHSSLEQPDEELQFLGELFL